MGGFTSNLFRCHNAVASIPMAVTGECENNNDLIAEPLDSLGSHPMDAQEIDAAGRYLDDGSAKRPSVEDRMRGAPQ